MERSGVFPSHVCAQVDLYFDQSVVSGQPRARVGIVHEYSLTLFVLATPSRRCSYLRSTLQLGTPQVSSYTQSAPGVLSLVWLEFWSLRDSTENEMLTYSMKALHIGESAVCHIRLMSCSRQRVDAHVLFDIGCLYSRRDRNGFSVATDMDGEAPDQDFSQIKMVHGLTLGHVSIATGRGEQGSLRAGYFIDEQRLRDALSLCSVR